MPPRAGWQCTHPRTGLDIRIPYATDPAGNRLQDGAAPDSTLTAWPDNRIAEDAHYVYRHDEYGRLTEKTDRIPAGVIRTDDERTHHYHYDSQHRGVLRADTAWRATGRAATSTTRWDGEWRNGYGGGA
ncbi:hypothetical protein ECZU03_36970 [Escherichia coli]|nr:hypothetical protein ECZU03_36970 [Escherichia coli]